MKLSIPEAGCGLGWGEEAEEFPSPVLLALNMGSDLGIEGPKTKVFWLGGEGRGHRAPQCRAVWSS